MVVVAMRVVMMSVMMPVIVAMPMPMPMVVVRAEQPSAGEIYQQSDNRNDRSLTEGYRLRTEKTLRRLHSDA